MQASGRRGYALHQRKVHVEHRHSRRILGNLGLPQEHLPKAIRKVKKLTSSLDVGIYQAAEDTNRA